MKNIKYLISPYASVNTIAGTITFVIRNKNIFIGKVILCSLIYFNIRYIQNYLKFEFITRRKYIQHANSKIVKYRKTSS